MSADTCLGLPGTVALAQRLQHADDREESCGGVAHAEPVPARMAPVVGAALLVLEPGDGLPHLVDARPVCERAGVAVAGHVTVHDSRVGGLRLLVAEAESLGDTGAQVVVEHVGRRDEVVRHALACFGLQVDGDGSLAALARRVRGVGLGADALDRADRS